MKFNAARKTVTSVGEISSKKIKMSFNQKASRLIFGQIYPDIKKAIVRELFTNAWDSQKIANTLHIPIDIHLPSTWEPYFSIRDYGVGMSPEVIDDVYSIIFESTKDQSNEEAGQWGMGSKSPWGYTDSFSLTSYIDGKYWYYELYIDSSGEPLISLKSTGETTEPNGVEVSLGVREEDFDVFKEHVERFALGANTPVNVNRKRFINQKEIFLQGDGWQFYKEDGPTQIRMGCVLYSLNENYLRSFSSISYDTLRLLKKPFVLDFAIGDFEVTGSREDIIYTREAVDKIVEKVEKAAEEFKEKAFIDIQNSSSYAEAWKKRREYKKYGFDIYGAKYGALKLQPHSVDVNLKIRYNPMRKTVLRKDNDSRSLSLSNLYDELSKINYFILHDRNKEVKNATSRIKNFVQTVKKYRCYKRDNWYASEYFQLYVVEYRNIQELRRLMVYLPKNSIIIDIEDLEKLPPTPRKPKPVNDMVPVLIPNPSWNSFYKVSPEKVKIKRGQYYVRAERSSFIERESDIRDALKFFNLSLKNCEILVIRKGDVRQIEKYDLVNLVAEYKKQKDFIRYNEDTLKWAVLNRNDHELRTFLYVPEFRKKYLPEFLYDKSAVDETFSYDVNEHTEKEYKEMKEKLDKKLDEFLEKNPIYKYFDKFRIETEFDEIEKIIGELRNG